MAKKSEVQLVLEHRIDNVEYSVLAEQKEREMHNNIHDAFFTKHTECDQAILTELDLARAEHQALNADAQLLSSRVDMKAEKSDLAVSADATDLSTALDLVNELKTIINAMNA